MSTELVWLLMAERFGGGVDCKDEGVVAST